MHNVGVTKFATAVQSAAIEPDGTADIINHNWVWHNKAEGIKPKTGANGVTVSFNEMLENGQMGEGGGGDVNSTFTGNVIERNNEDGVGGGFEAGGSKFAGHGTLVQADTFKNNNGMGLWADSGAYSMTFNNNVSFGNLAEGIRFELSGLSTGASVITNNTVGAVGAGTTDGAFNNAVCIAAHIPFENGIDCCTGAQTGTCGTTCISGTNKAFGEIDVADSNTVTVGGIGAGNTVASKCAGIRLTNDGRATTNPTFGATVSYNTVTYLVATPLSAPAGFATNATVNIFAATPANTFNNNSWTFQAAPDYASSGFAAQNGTANATVTTGWTGWQASGMDAAGSVHP